MSGAAWHAGTAQALIAAAARARETGRTQWIGVPARIELRDALALFASVDATDRFVLERPSERLQAANKLVLS